MEERKRDIRHTENETEANLAGKDGKGDSERERIIRADTQV